MKKLVGSLLAVFLAVTTAANAAVFVVPQGLFPSIDVRFDEVPLATPFNGLTINGYTFGNNVPGNVILAGPGAGPGNTNNITQPSALSLTNPLGEFVTIAMPGPTSAFGFGFAILATGTVIDAVTITLFDGATNLGSLVYSGSPDPTFSGGFAGISSTVAFTSAQLTFSPAAAAFDIDNIRSLASVVPEPGTLALIGCALAGLAATRRRKR